MHRDVRDSSAQVTTLLVCFPLDFEVNEESILVSMTHLN